MKGKYKIDGGYLKNKPPDVIKEQFLNLGYKYHSTATKRHLAQINKKCYLFITFKLSARYFQLLVVDLYDSTRFDCVSMYYAVDETWTWYFGVSQCLSSLTNVRWSLFVSTVQLDLVVDQIGTVQVCNILI